MTNISLSGFFHHEFIFWGADAILSFASFYFFLASAPKSKHKPQNKEEDENTWYECSMRAGGLCVKCRLRPNICVVGWLNLYLVFFSTICAVGHLHLYDVRCCNVTTVCSYFNSVICLFCDIWDGQCHIAQFIQFTTVFDTVTWYFIMWPVPFILCNTTLLFPVIYYSAIERHCLSNFNFHCCAAIQWHTLTWGSALSKSNKTKHPQPEHPGGLLPQSNGNTESTLLCCEHQGMISTIKAQVSSYKVFHPRTTPGGIFQFFCR